MPGTLICYGDSNTYGYDPHDTNEGRYPKEVRWTGILDTETDWKVENHGVNGRSIPHTVSTVKFACQQVRDWHRKPNSVWLLVMLGTNDLLENPDFTAADVAKRMVPAGYSPICCGKTNKPGIPILSRERPG